MRNSLALLMGAMVVLGAGNARSDVIYQWQTAEGEQGFSCRFSISDAAFNSGAWSLDAIRDFHCTTPNGTFDLSSLVYLSGVLDRDHNLAGLVMATRLDPECRNMTGQAGALFEFCHDEQGGVLGRSWARGQWSHTPDTAVPEGASTFTLTLLSILLLALVMAGLALFARRSREGASL